MGVQDRQQGIWSLARVLFALFLVGTCVPGRTAEATDVQNPPTLAPVAAAPECKLTGEKERVAVRVERPQARAVTALTILVGHPQGLLSIRSADDAQLTNLLAHVPANAITAVIRLDTGLRIVLGRSPTLPLGELFTIEFDRCAGAPRATAADFRCAVEAAGNASGPVRGATCAVRIL